MGHRGAESVEVLHEKVELVETRGDLEVVVDALEDFGLCAFDLLVGVAPVGGVGLVRRSRGLDLLILAGNVQAGDSNQLEVTFAHILSPVELTVAEVGGQPPCLPLEAQLETDFHGPVQQDAAVVPLYFWTLLQVEVLQERPLVALAFDQAVHTVAFEHEGPRLLLLG